MQDKVKLLRLGRSLTDEVLNKKYSIDYLSGAIQQSKDERSEQVDEMKRRLVDQTQVLFLSF